MGPTPEWPTRDLLSYRAATTPAATALVEATGETTWSYADLDASVGELATTVRSALDAPPAGETASRPRVGIAATTSPAFVVALYATWRCGVIAVPVATSRPGERIRRRLDRLDVDLWLDTDDEAGLSAVEPDVQALTVDPTSGDGRSPGGGSSDTDSSVATWDATETALILFTSGTAGRPKGVRLTHRNLVASATASAFRLGIDRADRWHCCLPTNHMGGLAPIVRSTLYGTSVVLDPEFDASRTPELMAEHDATGVSLVPTMLQRCLEAGWEPHETLRFVLLGGAPAATDLVETCERVGVPVYPTYGTTETASQIATATPEAAFADPETVGAPLVAASVTIVDTETGAPVDPGTVGELVVDGPIVTPGYLDKTATEAAVGAHGLHTGDLARRDDGGRLRIIGRLDDAIQTGGETVHPARVSSVLRELPEIAEAAVVGLPDPDWGERVAALVVPADESSLDVDTIRPRLRDRLAPHAVPKVLESADELPRTASGTVDRDAVRDQLRG